MNILEEFRKIRVSQRNARPRFPRGTTIRETTVFLSMPGLNKVISRVVPVKLPSPLACRVETKSYLGWFQHGSLLGALLSLHGAHSWAKSLPSPKDAWLAGTPTSGNRRGAKTLSTITQKKRNRARLLRTSATNSSCVVMMVIVWGGKSGETISDTPISKARTLMTREREGRKRHAHFNHQHCFLCYVPMNARFVRSFHTPWSIKGSEKGINHHQQR